MIDLFRQLKLDYNKYVVLFKSGSFYICFDEDSIILNKLFGYKIVELKNNIKVGFPIQNLDIVLNKLDDLKINYIIIDNKNIIQKRKNLNNNFSKYTSSVFEYININHRIDIIASNLRNMKKKDAIKLIEKIEDILSNH